MKALSLLKDCAVSVDWNTDLLRDEPDNRSKFSTQPPSPLRRSERLFDPRIKAWQFHREVKRLIGDILHEC
jgi:hypothetical protein